MDFSPATELADIILRDLGIEDINVINMYPSDFDHAEEVYIEMYKKQVSPIEAVSHVAECKS